MDANRGDLLLGWDTDQFPTDLYLTTQCMLVILEPGRPRARRRQLRRQGAPRELRAGRPVPRPHRRHGRLRPRPEDRRQDPRGRRAEATSSSSATPRGTTASASKIEAGKASFDDLETYMLEKGDATAERLGPAGDAGEHHQPLFALIHTVSPKRERGIGWIKRFASGCVANQLAWVRMPGEGA